MPVCARLECKRTAEVIPKVVVPHAVGFPIEKSRQYAVMLGLKVCRRCCSQMSGPEQAKLPNLMDFFRKLAASRAKRFKTPYQEPDFERAFIVKVKLSSDEYRKIAPRLEQAPTPADQLPAGVS